MKLSTKGLVIWEVRSGEADRVITILTPSGIITAYARNSLRPNNKLTSATSLFTYSDFELYEGKNMYNVDDAMPLSMFHDITFDVFDYALSVYLAELTKNFAPVEDDSVSFLSLFLNTLYLLNEQKYPKEHIKAVFEMKISCLAGYMPELYSCGICGSHVNGDCFFDIMNGVVRCVRCTPNISYEVEACPAGTLKALRYIAENIPSKCFSFSLGELSFLSRICEKFVAERLDRKSNTLEYYKSLFI